MDFQLYAMELKQGRKKYLSKLSFSEAGRLVQLTDWNEVPPELAPQRPKNRAHVRKIADYVQEHPESWNFPTITLVVDRADYRSLGNHPFGRLIIPSSSKIYPIDGQHRIAALRALLEKIDRRELEGREISVEIFVGLSLPERQDLFVTLNTTKKVSRQVIMAIDQSEETRIARRMANEVIHFSGLIDKQRAAVPRGSSMLFSLTQLHDAYIQAAKDTLFPPGSSTPNPNVEAAIIATAEIVASSIHDYSKVREGDVSVRETSLACDPFFLQGIFDAIFKMNFEGALPSEVLSLGLSRISFEKYVGSQINPRWERVLLPLPLARPIKTKANKNSISRQIQQEIWELSAGDSK